MITPLGLLGAGVQALRLLDARSLLAIPAVAALAAVVTLEAWYVRRPVRE
ncbi:MAG: hypothetical protein U0Q15_18000 [Kineosporiaceae bacterium]